MTQVQTYMSITRQDAGLLDSEVAYRSYYGDRQYDDLIPAWHDVVDRRLTRPAATELDVWTSEQGMSMGHPNALHLDVPTGEQPEAYGERVAGAPEAFKERAGYRTPVEVFLSGLPTAFPNRQHLFNLLRGMDQTRIPEIERLGALASQAQVYYTNQALQPLNRHPGRDSARQSSSRQGQAGPYRVAMATVTDQQPQ